MITAYTFAITSPILAAIKQNSNITIKSFNSCLNHVGHMSVSGNTCYLSAITSVKPEHRLLFVNQLGPADLIRNPIIFEAKDKTSTEGARIYDSIGRAAVEQSYGKRMLSQVSDKYPELPDNRAIPGIYATNVQAAVNSGPESELMFSYMMSSVIDKTQDPAFDNRAITLMNTYHSMSIPERIYALKIFDADIGHIRSRTQNETAYTHLGILQTSVRIVSKYLSR